MCGIFGFLNFGHCRPAAIAEIEAMGATMQHRGPDETGWHIDGGLAIGAARLSIIDLTTGRQPISIDNGRIVTVLNGEIYNYSELRESLVKSRTFHTRTDTEVIAHLYHAVDLELLRLLNGMFAFALWDAVRQRLIFARDPIGQKPLFFQRTESAIAFASEPKAIFAWSNQPKRLRGEAVIDYLAYDYVPQPKTMYSDILQLPAGHYAIVTLDGQVSIERYWQPRFAYVDWDRIGGDGPLAKAIFDKFVASVGSHLNADVPVGMFLSGGIDSSSVVAVAREVRNEGTLRTYSARFQERGFDEGPYIESVIHHVGTDHTDVPISADVFRTAAEELIRTLDEPVPDPSIVTRYIIARRARDDVKVLLSGDGGDELFAGYPTFHSRVIFPLFRYLRASLGRFLIEAVKRLAPVGTGNFSARYVLDRVAQSIGLQPEAAVQALISSFSGRDITNVVLPGNGLTGETHQVYKALTCWAASNTGLTVVERLTLFYLNWYLPYDLSKVDRAGMATSVEIRAPFLDRTMLDLSLAIPETYKIRGTQLKYALKRAVDGVLPDDVLHRGKRGFSVPVGKWLKGPLAGWMSDILERDRIHADGVFNPSAVSALIDAHLAGKTDNGRALWSLMMFSMWQRSQGVVLQET